MFDWGNFSGFFRRKRTGNTMKTGIRTFYFIAIWLVVTGCTYDFSEDYYKEIDLKDPNVNIVLTGFSNGEETSSSKMVKYALSGVGNGDFEMVVTVDGTEIFWSQERTGEFFLAVDELEDGQHKLSIDFGFPTNSGSLASSLGGEYYTATAEYGFTVDKTLANSFGIKSVEIVEGSIVIKLNPVTDNNFDEAFLLIQNEGGQVVEERPLTEQEMTTREIRDLQTVDYNPGYAIKVKNAFVEDVSEFVVLPTPKMEFTTEVVGFESFKLILYGTPAVCQF